MGRRNRKVKNELIKLCSIIIILIILVVLSKIGYLEKIKDFGVKIGILENSSGTIKTEEISESQKENINLDKEKLNILFLNVGQADCEVIVYKDNTVLIDAGNKQDGELVVDELNKLGITKLDYVIGTHVHEDHIGGMSYIIDAFEIDKFYLPYDTKTTSSYYKDLLNSLTNKDLQIEEASVGDKISLDDLEFEVMSVDNNQPEDANDSSIVLELTYGEEKYLFMGDATSKNEKQRNWNDVDVLKVGHHGSNTSSSQDFLNQVLPEIAIISVGKDNSYGLPKENIIERYNDLGSKIYRTDYDGTIQIISDGKTNEINKIDISFDGNN